MTQHQDFIRALREAISPHHYAADMMVDYEHPAIYLYDPDNGVRIFTREMKQQTDAGTGLASWVAV